jgi:uncharacterized DUF497 family protein
MIFTWDEEKRKTNKIKHGLDFADAHIVFKGTTLSKPDNRFDYGENRYQTIGFLKSAVVIAHTETPDEIRIISMRKATKHEEKKYFEHISR